MRLSNTTPKRLFTFGCSFTDYRWATWANILAYELDCEFYNFGKSGAGNCFIANQVTQANNIFHFNKDDLIIVCWTNISREDRWVTGKGWVTAGNIYSQGEYDKKFVKHYANDIHFALRDFSVIDLTTQYLKNTNFHYLAMCDVKNHINQWENCDQNRNAKIKRITALYQESLNIIAPSFYESLWHNNINNKWKKDWQDIHKNYSDGHPTPKEHLEYLQRVFTHSFSSRTVEAVHNLHNEWVEFIRECYQGSKRSYGLHDLPQQIQENMSVRFRLKRPEEIPNDMWH